MPEEEDRQKFTRLAYEAQMLRGQGQGLQEQINAVTMSIAQLNAAVESLKSLKGKSSGLVPIGAGVLAPADLGGGKVLVDVGANVLVEKDYDDALKSIEERMAEALDAQKKLHETAVRLNQRLHGIDREARELVGRMNAGQQME